MLTNALLALIPIALLAGWSKMTTRRNYLQGYPSTIGDWVVGLITTAVTVLTVLLIGSDREWYGALVGFALAVVGMRPIIRVWAAPRETSLTGSVRPSWVWAVAGAVVLVGTFLGMGLWVGFIAATALMVVSAVTEVIWGDEQMRRLRAVAAPLAAVLGIAEERILDSAPVVDDDGTITVRHPHATTIARLDRIEALVAQAMPSYEVAQATSSRIVLVPVGVQTMQRRDSLASSGGLVAGTSTEPVHPSRGVELTEW